METIIRKIFEPVFFSKCCVNVLSSHGNKTFKLVPYEIQSVQKPFALDREARSCVASRYNNNSPMEFLIRDKINCILCYVPSKSNEILSARSSRIIHTPVNKVAQWSVKRASVAWTFKDETYLCYIRTLCVPRSKHSSPRS